MSEDVLSDAFFDARERDLKKRLKPKRFEHARGVSKTAASLAETYGVDVRKARLAGLLHDWDKALLPAQSQQRISDFDLKVSPEVINGMPWVLHGPTAAAVLRRDFPCFGEEVFQAIERHTVGAPDMAPLDMIVFVADKIEPTHDVAEYKRLYKQIGTMSLEEVFYAVLKEGMSYLVRAGKPISYDSVTVWNCYNGAKPQEQ